MLPDIYKELELYADILPSSAVSPVHPFGGFVVNINVCTKIHRDVKDKDICLVFVISQCSGGELALREPGIVLDLQDGDAIIFNSVRLSHLNLDYSGYRASLVFHTDASSDGWVNGRNCWSHNVFMRTNESVGYSETL